MPRFKKRTWYGECNTQISPKSELYGFKWANTHKKYVHDTMQLAHLSPNPCFRWLHYIRCACCGSDKGVAYTEGEGNPPTNVPKKSNNVQKNLQWTNAWLIQGGRENPPQMCQKKPKMYKDPRKGSKKALDKSPSCATPPPPPRVFGSIGGFFWYLLAGGGGMKWGVFWYAPGQPLHGSGIPNMCTLQAARLGHSQLYNNRL